MPGIMLPRCYFGKTRFCVAAAVQSKGDRQNRVTRCCDDGTWVGKWSRCRTGLFRVNGNGESAPRRFQPSGRHLRSGTEGVSVAHAQQRYSAGAKANNMYLILDPPEMEGDHLPHAALIWYPGAFIDGLQYKAFAKQAQEKLAGKVRLWVCLVVIDWGAIVPPDVPKEERKKYFEAFYPEPSLTVAGLIPQLEAKGFKPKKSTLEGETRYLNVATGGHSAGRIFAGQEASRSAGPLILIATPIHAMVSSTGVAGVLWDHPYPVLMVLGELDAPVRWHAFAQAIVESIRAALVFGKKWAATRKNVSVVPGMDHMQIAELEPIFRFGGITPDIGTEEALAKCGELVAAFIDVHFGDGDQLAPTAVLEDGLFGATMDIVGPFLAAVGQADVSLALEKIKQGDQQDRLPAWKRSGMLGYDEEGLASATCAQFQNLLFPESMTARVVPIVVNSVDSFFAAKPVWQASVDSGPPMIVPVCHMYVPPRGDTVKAPPRMAEYWMKLALSKEATYSFDTADGDMNGSISIADFASKRNSEMFTEAMKISTEKSMHRYNVRGIPPRFGSDIVSKGNRISLEEWAAHGNDCESTYDAAAKENVIQSLVHTGDDFIMVKTWSLARALEYIAIVALQRPE